MPSILRREVMQMKSMLHHAPEIVATHVQEG